MLNHTLQISKIIDFLLFSKVEKKTESETTSRINTGALYSEGKDISHRKNSDHDQPGCFQQTGIELTRSFSKYRERPQGETCREREEWVEKMREKTVMNRQNKLMNSLVCHTGAEFCNRD